MVETDLIDIYAQSFVVKDLCYNLMSMMLDHDYLYQHMSWFGVDESLYIYGGGSIGVQFYQNIKDKYKVKAFVNERGNLYRDACYGWGYHIPEVKLYTLEQFKKIYEAETVIITDITRLNDIYKTLNKFVEDKKLIYINELVYGGVRNALHY